MSELKRLIKELKQENQQLRKALEEHYELSKRLMDYKGLKDTGIIMRTEQLLDNAKNESNSQNT